jgi:hypothetical protein
MEVSSRLVRYEAAMLLTLGDIVTLGDIAATRPRDHARGFHHLYRKQAEAAMRSGDELLKTRR